MATDLMQCNATSDGDERARVLVVDDERGIRSLLAEILSDEGYEVRQAEDGERALEVLAGWDADVILLDLSMPRMTGWEFLQARRERRIADGTPVIVMSASRNIDEDALHAHAVLGKPFEITRFLDALRDSLPRSA
jgi:CheY-like chemotaxis protein